MSRAVRLDEPDEDGWFRMRLELPWPEEVPGQLMGVGSSLEVLDPPEIREQIRATVSRLVKVYRIDGDGATE